MKPMFQLLRSSLIAAFICIGFQAQSQFTEEKKISDNDLAYENQLMHLRVFNPETNSEVSTDLIVSGLDPRKPVVLSEIRDTTIHIPAYRRYTITAVKEDYMFYSERFWPDEKKLHEQPISLSPLKVGLKSNVPGIIFLGNKTEIYHKSDEALQNLYQFLKKNPTVEIAINGHVNDPDDLYSDKFLEKASRDRAQAVVDYLVGKGIDKKRLKAVGKGSKEMIYPDPQTDWQNEENRRVEIEITSL